MARWKLTRLTFGNNEEYTLLDGDEVSIGRGINNNIPLSSIVISRNHCVLNVQKDQVLITDLKSSNGVYVGLKKIPPNKPYSLQELDVIGLGWTKGAPVANIKDTEKYMFKITKEKPPPINSRIMYQSDNEFEDLETELAAFDAPAVKSPTNKKTPEKNKNEKSPVPNRNTAAKRKLDVTDGVKVKKEKIPNIVIDLDVINISDSENEMPAVEETVSKKPKLDSIIELEEAQPAIKQEEIKVEKDDEYDPFKVKQEYLGYDVDEPIQIDSDSDDESAHWRMRLSQSSPAKSLTKAVRESKAPDLEESCYSQMDDFEDDFVNDIITIPPQPPENIVDNLQKQQIEKDNISLEEAMKIIDKDTIEDEEFLDDLISLDKGLQVVPQVINDVDTVDGSCSNSKSLNDLKTTSTPDIEPQPDKVKQAQMIDPLAQMPRSKPSTSTDSKPKPSTSSKHIKDKHKNKKHSSSSSKRRISDSQKEERKRKLKELATKEKEEIEKSLKSSTISSKDAKDKGVSKLSNTNRGAFLTEVVQGVVKPTTRKEGQKSSKNKDKDVSTTHKEDKKELDDIENKKKDTDKSNSTKHKDSDKLKEENKHKEKDSASKTKSSRTHSNSHKTDTKTEIAETETKLNRYRVPLKSLKPLTESEESFSGKPFSKVEPLPPPGPAKPKKKVSFSQQPPKVHVFEIEPGNNLKKTSLVKTSLLDSRHTPSFSLEKMTLMRVFRWNPQWLDEQINQAEPPPILGHQNPPMTMFHTFSNHHQYVELVGDLLLMEIWECLTQAYNRVRGVDPGIVLRIASLPPVSTQDRRYELFNLSVNVSVPNNEAKIVPRMGEIMIVAFGLENARCKRFFYVHNVRQLASPPNNINNFYCISLHTCYTEKMKDLKPGEPMVGLRLAYIHNELMLFEAMEHLAGSPLSEAILTPEPKHFIKCEPKNFPVTPWTKFLNPSQQTAVHSAVTAALGDRPCIEMIQGPPGTGKSSVISAIVMSYFYDTNERKHQNRGKILICATSNAAVDELVIRLLNIRQNLPKTERFKMVRVGRAEAMHPKAFDVSSISLAQREARAAARYNEPLRPGLTEEISTLEAKINMWQTQELDAKDQSRAAYCRERVKGLMNRIAMLRAGGGGGGGGEKELQVAQAERRIIEFADIVLTTLTSAHSMKMRGLRRRIALCIIDEAGQANEPETLIPLTLDVTKLALIGDPQQLPGFICSQRAKKLGLGESLFYRLTSCAETWPEGGPVILLNQQYRMQTDIADYPNRAFYDGRIVSMPPPRPNLDIPPYSIVSISSGDKGQGASGANEMEAWGVARLVTALQTLLRSYNMTLAVITPYNAHKELIKRNLKLLQDNSEAQSTSGAASVEVNTVDSFQGQERDVVVVSLARSQGLGFLADAGRMNVMLTRARHALLVCLNPHAMIKNFQWRTLVEDAERRKMYRYLPSKICQGLSAGQIPHSEVLKYVTCHKTGTK